MAKITVKYNPYKLETKIVINGHQIEKDSALFRVVKGKRLQEWIGKFPKMLVDELNCVDFEIDFIGVELDWDDFELSFSQAKETGVLRNLKLNLIETKSDESINEKITQIFQDLQDGPVDDFRDVKLTRAFENVNNAIFPINVIATMSSGKSTLINSLLCRKLMPSKNEACTATITEILDNDEDIFNAIAFNEENDIVARTNDLTYEEMTKFNDDEEITRISAKGNIPFLDSRSTALMLVDTPGPNNAQNQTHKNITYRAINIDSNNLILYVLNGTQLSTNDDHSLLEYVAEQIKKGGKMARDRFLFVINKMDDFNPEEEDIAKAVDSARRYLSGFGIEDPQLFPCSAYTALNIRTFLSDIDIDNLSRAEEKKLPSAARDTLNAIDKFNEFESMHLEQYSTLSPSAQRELNYKLKVAEENGDTKEQALIHCGIYSIEAAIIAYVKKYAKTKKIKDLVETFQEVLESSQVLAKAKNQVATDESAAKELADRVAIIKEKIDNGKEAEEFKLRINALNPMPKIEDKAEQLSETTTKKVKRVFEPYGDDITSREDAKRLVAQFATSSSDAIAELSSELESVIQKEIIETGAQLLDEYQRKILALDEMADHKHLEFDTVDLIKGVLSNMRENAESWSYEQLAADNDDAKGEVTVEEKIYHVKTGQKEEKVWVGSHQEKVGTEHVKVDTRRERKGSHYEKNPERRGLGILKFWKPMKIEVIDYETVDVYEDRDIMKTVDDYETVMRDVFEERVERIEKFRVATSVIQTGMIRKLRQNLDEGIESAKEFAENQISKMKQQFEDISIELDELIKSKYEELSACTSDQAEKEAILAKNKSILEWIQANKSEINSVLEMDS